MSIQYKYKYRSLLAPAPRGDTRPSSAWTNDGWVVSGWTSDGETWILFWDIRRDCRMRERRGHVRREMSMMTLPTTRMEFDDGRARMLQEEY